MIPQNILERLQAGAIVAPGKPVLTMQGEIQVFVKAIDLMDLSQMEVQFTNQQDETPEAMDLLLREWLPQTVASVKGVQDIDDENVDIDVKLEPSALSHEFWVHVLRDVMRISSLNKGLVGKSESPSEAESTPASKTAAVKVSAAPAASKTPASKTSSRAGKTTPKRRNPKSG